MVKVWLTALQFSAGNNRGKSAYLLILQRWMVIDYCIIKQVIYYSFIYGSYDSII